MAQATRTFRIFVSSTFADLKEERNALQKEVFPKLRRLCLENGSRFQAIDLRWGVREEAGLDQRTMTICLDEIERCRQTSPRPNFIVLLGDRYGWRPLPPVIPGAERAAIRGAVTAEADARLIEAWYLRDDNADPPEYCLKPRLLDLGACRTDQERDQVRRRESEAWAGTERALRAVLVPAADRAGLSEAQKLKYTASATEQEVERGALTIPDAGEHVFCFCRRIADLPGDAGAKDFTDLDEAGRFDDDARARLDRLKEKLATTLPGNVYTYDAQWTGTAATTGHLAQLCEDVWTSLSGVILAEIARFEHVDAVEKEQADHEAFARDRATCFTGRAAILEAIAAYLRGAGGVPLAMTGASGSGKSAVMARAAEQARSALPDAEIVLRFIGATPGSSDIRTLLEGLCREISRRFASDEDGVPTDYKDLVQELPKRLALATAGRPLVLVLDALDQLSDADHARNLHWLPAQVPEHVRLVVSALSGECQDALKRKLPGANVLTLDLMPVDEGGRLLDLWLGAAHRRLQACQRSDVLEKFALSAARGAGAQAAGGGPAGAATPHPGGLPLYLKLAFEEARRWRSYSPAVSLGPSVPAVIGDLFARLSSDASHGPVLVGHALGYLAAARNGLSEDEMLDVLSEDPAVFQDFMDRARHQPPEHRLPIVVWSRLFFDLEPYLTERSADGASLLAFYHRQLREAVEAAFLPGETKRVRHAALAKYFGGQGLFEKEQRAPNLRKLSELPYQQTNGDLWEELYSTLTDFDFLEAKCTHVAVVTEGRGDSARTVHGGVYELQEDYRRALQRFPAEK